MLCEMCNIIIATWHQRKPVERFLCSDCAYKDQIQSKNWEGSFDSDGFSKVAQSSGQ